jgi:hypothetical protein
MHTKCYSGSLKERENMGDPIIDRRIILKWREDVD